MFFGRHNICKVEDRVLITTDLKFTNICEDVLRANENKTTVLAVFYFEETLERFKKSLDERNLRYQILETSRDISNWNFSGTDKLNIFSFETFISLKGVYTQTQEKESLPIQKIKIIILEHYPLPEKDKETLALAEIFSVPNCTFTFYVSLEEPFMKIFGSDKIRMLLEKLGCSEGHVVHPMITAAIAQAQGKVKQKATGDEKARSSEAWFHYFCPALYEKLKRTGHSLA